MRTPLEPDGPLVGGQESSNKENATPRMGQGNMPPPRCTKTNIRRAIETSVPGHCSFTAHNNHLRVVDSLEPALLAIAEAFALDPLSEMGSVCDLQMKRNIACGMVTQKLGFAAYCISHALFGEACRVPLMTHFDRNPQSYYNSVVLPAVALVENLSLSCQGNCREFKFESLDILEKNFHRWSSTLHARQRYGVWSSHYLLSSAVPKDENGHVNKHFVKGIYYPMHRLLFLHTRKYARKYLLDGNFLTPAEVLAHSDLVAQRRRKFLHG